MARYLRLLVLQLRASLLVGAQYRVDFFVDGAIEILWTVTTLAPLGVLIAQRRAIAGWSLPEALVVVAFFTLLQAFLEGALNPSFAAAVEHVRRGSLDHVLMKPADAQFLLTTGRVLPWRAVNLVTASVMLVVAFAGLGRAPSLRDVAVSAVAFGAALATLVALFTFALATVLAWVRTDGIADLLSGLLDGARWPVTIYRGSLRALFTFVLPFGVLTTFPAQALLGALDGAHVAMAIGEAVALSVVARAIFQTALRSYGSSSS